MIMLTSLRTGVEVMGDDDAALVPIVNWPGTPLAQVGIIATGVQNLHLHPDVWVHPILAPGTNNEVGQLVLVNPVTSIISALQGPGMTRTDVIRDVYRGLADGKEHWLWPTSSLQAGNAWPADFDLRGTQYPTEVRNDPTDLVVSYLISNFPVGPGVPGSRPALPPEPDAQLWDIWTDADPQRPIGAMATSPTTQVQTWWARPSYLVGRVIPPGSDGRWRFRENDGTDWGDDYVELVLGPVATDVSVAGP